MLTHSRVIASGLTVLDRAAKVVATHPGDTAPLDRELTGQIERLLNAE